MKWIRGRRPWQWICLAGAVLCGIFLLLGGSCGILSLIFSQIVPLDSGAASVGIIGGADGPTAIFVTGPGWGILETVIPLILMAGCLVGFLLPGRKEK